MQPRRRPLVRRLGWLGLGAALAIAMVIAFLVGPLRQRLQPQGLASLQARLSPDGRLLGHFAYPEASEADLVSLEGGLKLRPAAADALERMLAAARADGIDLRVLSAFRSVAEQERLFFAIKAERNQTARERARVSAPPGHSEHGTGFAVDLGDGRQPGSDLNPSFEQSAAYRWLAANAARFQYTLSFPRGNPQGVAFEPWHWRFEGSTEALRLFERSQRLSR